MIVVGTPDEWVDLIDSMVPQILDLVVATWGEMPPLDSDAREDPTTEALCRRLRQSRSAADLPFRIDIQMVELDPLPDQNHGRLDIAFSPVVPRENIYFALECKRLNVVRNSRVRSYASEYVNHGMSRFIQGQYASNVRHGGMLGYVLDHRIKNAIGSVRRVVHSKRTQLKMQPSATLADSSLRPGDGRIKESQHSRPPRSQPFTIHHIFMATT